ncbi:MAG: amidase [Pirellulales bacterium]|nr:amidase [Pirellulales bacterium]
MSVANVRQSTESALCDLAAGQIAAGVAAGEFSAREAVDACIARVEAVDGQLNALVWKRFNEARREADDADAARARGEILGPLGGVPITIKECLDVAGTPATLGIRRLAKKLSPVDGPLVARLRRAGAIIIGKTNVPQLGMYFETDGPLFGRTNNPWNLERSPGGSSGGEAAILAARGSALGLATDAGGSIRHPAHCCGLHGLKPTSGRLSQVDLPMTTTRAGDVQLPAMLSGLHSILQLGPMARHVADLALAMQVLAASGQNEFDISVPPMDWCDYRRVDVGRLRVGFYVDDEVFSVSPAIRRAVLAAVDALRGCGAHVEPFAPPNVAASVALFQRLIFPDGGAAFRRMLGGEQADPRINRFLQTAALPEVARNVLGWILKRAGQPRLAAGAMSVRKLSADEFRRDLAERAATTARFLAAMDVNRLDAIVCPVHPVPAPRHRTGPYLGLISSYTSLYNLLGMPAGTVAATRVRAGEETSRKPGREVVERVASGLERESAGLPVGVQVVSRHWREDVVLALMHSLEGYFRAQPDYPERPPL